MCAAHLHMVSLYWTHEVALLRVGFLVNGKSMKRSITVLLMSLSASLSWAQAVSADAAAQALLRGAAVLDIRPAGDYLAGHLPGAVSAAAAAQACGREELQALVSGLGIDLSREVIVVGQPGDAQAQALQSRLAAYATGRVSWLVGGVHEWVLTGRPVATEASRLPPVPQFLVPLQPSAASPRMAGASVRDLARPAVRTSPNSQVKSGSSPCI